MTTAQQQLATLSMARRAGRLVLGFERVVEQMKEGQLCGVYYTQDLSPQKPEGAAFLRRAAQAAADVFAADHAGHPAGLRQTLRHCRCNG